MERGVTIGSKFVAYGKVFYDRMNKKLVMNNPEYFLKDKSGLITILKNKSATFTNNLAVFSVLMIVFALLLYRRAQKVLKVVKIMIEEEKLKKSQDKLYNVDKIEI